MLSYCSTVATTTGFIVHQNGLQKRFNRQKHVLSMVMAPNTCVVGGGLAGLATAAALRRIANTETKILERFSENEFTSKTAGAAIQLGPNGLRALQAIGGDELLQRIYKEGTCLKQNAILMAQSKDPLIIPDTTEHDTGLPQVLVRWAKLREVLKELVPAETIQTGVDDIFGCTKDNGSMRLLSASRETLLTTPLVVGADGIYSTIGALMRLDDETILPEGKEDEARKACIKDGGRVNIKAVAPVNLGSDFASQTTYSYFAPPAACFAGPAGEGYTYWAISIPDDEDSRHFLSDTEMPDKALVKAKLLDRLRGLEVPECQFAIDLIDETDSDVIVVARSEEVDIPSTLVSSDGGVVLVGDAAHAMSPGYGQAANFAFEDAVTLAACLRDGEDLPSALQTYSDSRLDRCREMQRRSAERAAKAARGETADDVSKWIFQWTADSILGEEGLVGE